VRLYFDRLELHLGFYLCGPLSGESEYVILINYKSSSKFLLCSMPSAVLLQTNNALNLDEDISGKPCNLYSGSCGLVVSKELLIDKIDGGEVIHRFEEYCGFDDLSKLRAAGFYDGFEIGECLKSLLVDVSFTDKHPLGIERYTS